MIVVEKFKRYELDVHGYTMREVDTALNKLIRNIDPKYEEVEVIHGYNYGTRLREHIRNEYSNNKIERIVYFDNPGRTSLFLKKSQFDFT